MSIDVADLGLLETVLDLSSSPSVAATGEAIAEALGVPAAYASFVERRLHRNRELGLVDRDEDGSWRPTAAGLAATDSARILGQLV